MARTIKLMLVKTVDGLGALGDVVKVRPGYARNYLLPRGLAAPVSQDALKRVAAENKKAALEAQKAVENARAAQEKLRAITLHLESKAGEGGHLYGSVTGAMIAEALVKHGIGIDATAVNLENPIKELGIYTVAIKLHSDVTGLVKVYVVQPAPEKGEAKKADAAKK
jgi:large subunit ribosomal protein L9